VLIVGLDWLRLGAQQKTRLLELSDHVNWIHFTQYDPDGA
jgi:hypothetical protein